MCRDGDASKFGERVATFQEMIAKILTRLDDIEHGILSQTAILTHVFRTHTEAGQVCAGILGVLRLKTAHMMRKPIPGPSARSRQTQEDDAYNTHYDLCTVGVSRTDVDCSLAQLVNNSRVVKVESCNAVFSPPFTFTQVPARDIDPVEIVFQSVYEICSILSIN